MAQQRPSVKKKHWDLDSEKFTPRDLSQEEIERVENLYEKVKESHLRELRKDMRHEF
jgi:hypothetical protein